MCSPSSPIALATAVEVAVAGSELSALHATISLVTVSLATVGVGVVVLITLHSLPGSTLSSSGAQFNWEKNHHENHHEKTSHKKVTI